MAYQNILIPIDGSETSLSAIQHAVEFSKAFKSKITIVQVMTLDPYIATEYLSNTQGNQLIERAKQFIQDNLNVVQEKFANDGITVETKLLEGENISQTITQAVDDLNIDLVILSSHGRTGLKKLIMGSVAQSLITDLHIPVFVIK